MSNDSDILLADRPCVPTVMPWTTITRDGVRTLHYYGRPIGFYMKGRLGEWKGVTIAGQLVRANREGHVRQMLKEAAH